MSCYVWVGAMALAALAWSVCPGHWHTEAAATFWCSSSLAARHLPPLGMMLWVLIEAPLQAVMPFVL